ncbi:MAG TPA: choice-of-anchor J domain-containing protein [Parafilimonas sp.]|nr:choice-of-anchor J domain-containing protein [Parafilimonas sp.]
MKNFSLFFILCFTGFSVGFIHSCSKDAGMPIPGDTPPDSVITTSFIEEFRNVPILTTTTGWITKSVPNGSTGTITGMWEQGQIGTDKSGNPYGLQAFSTSGSKDEYIYSPAEYSSPINNWLITPVLSVKNGDKISFYTCAYEQGYYTDRMQVLMNKSKSTDVGSSPNSTGSFTQVLFDINSKQESGGYPDKWQKYEYTFSGISGTMNTRIAFRHYVKDPAWPYPGGIGIDVFKFGVK